MKWSDALAMIAAMIAAPIAAWGLLAVLPAVGFVLLPGYFLWEVFGKGRRQREIERKRNEAARQRVEDLIRLHLVAHGMADNLLNRALVLDHLARPSRPRRK